MKPSSAGSASADANPSSGSRTRSDPAPLQETGIRAPAAPPASPEAAVMAAREAAQNAKTLDDLRALLEDFEGCALRATATQLVFADGNPQSRVMFVGEAPGYDEDIVGRPFVGRSGKLARPHAGGDRARPHQGLHRQRRAVAAARQPHADAAGNRDLPALHPPPDRACQSRISWSASAGRRRKPCSAPRTASRARAAAGSPTTPARAKSARSPTFHPAFLLRSPLQKRFAWRDFLALKKALADGSLHLHVRRAPPIRKSARGGANTSITSVSSGKNASCSMPPGITTRSPGRAGAPLASEPEFHPALEHPGDLLVRMFVGGRRARRLSCSTTRSSPDRRRDLAADLVGDIAPRGSAASDGDSLTVCGMAVPPWRCTRACSESRMRSLAASDRASRRGRGRRRRCPAGSRPSRCAAAAAGPAPAARTCAALRERDRENGP